MPPLIPSKSRFPGMPTAEEIEPSAPPAAAPGAASVQNQRALEARRRYEQGAGALDMEGAGLKATTDAIAGVPAPRNFKERFQLAHSPQAYMRQRMFESYKQQAISKHVTSYLENMERTSRVMAGLPPTVEEEREQARQAGENALAQQAAAAGFQTPEAYIGFQRLQQKLTEARKAAESTARTGKLAAETTKFGADTALAGARQKLVEKQTQFVGQKPGADAKVTADRQRMLIDMQKQLVDDIKAHESLLQGMKPKTRLPGAKKGAAENNATRELMALRRSLQNVRDELYSTPGMETFGAGIGARPPGFMEGMDTDLSGAAIRPANIETRIQQLLEVYGYGSMEDVPEEVRDEIAETLEAEGWE